MTSPRAAKARKAIVAISTVMTASVTAGQRIAAIYTVGTGIGGETGGDAAGVAETGVAVE